MLLQNIVLFIQAAFKLMLALLFPQTIFRYHKMHCWRVAQIIVTLPSAGKVNSQNLLQSFIKRDKSISDLLLRFNKVLQIFK